MATTIFNRILLIAVIALLGTVLLLVWLRPTRTVTVADPAAARKIVSLQRQYDSLQKDERGLEVLADTLQSYRDALAKQLDQQQQVTLKLGRQYLQTLQKYASLSRYDTLTAGDIGRYLSDSLP